MIGLGGGSSLDVAKLVALLLAGGEALAEVYGVGIAKGPRLPLLLAPTTAGTGSEVTPISIVTTGAREEGVCRPSSSRTSRSSIPTSRSACRRGHRRHGRRRHGARDRGLHVGRSNNNPMSRVLACEALRLIGRNIRRAVHHGSDPDARSGMLLGSMLAGQAFANAPVAAVHALAYPIGGHFGVPHGLSNALVLPHVLRFNASACAESYAALAPHAFPELTHASADAFIEAVTALAADLRLPPRLRDVGIPADAVPMMAEDALKRTRLLVNNPRPMTLADARAIYEAAW